MYELIKMCPTRDRRTDAIHHLIMAEMESKGTKGQDYCRIYKKLNIQSFDKYPIFSSWQVDVAAAFSSVIPHSLYDSSHIARVHSQLYDAQP